MTITVRFDVAPGSDAATLSSLGGLLASLIHPAFRELGESIMKLSEQLKAIQDHQTSTMKTLDDLVIRVQDDLSMVPTLQAKIAELQAQVASGAEISPEDQATLDAILKTDGDIQAKAAGLDFRNPATLPEPAEPAAGSVDNPVAAPMVPDGQA